MAERKGELSSSPEKDTDPTMGLHPHDLINLSKKSPSNAITSGLPRMSTGGHKHSVHSAGCRGWFVFVPLPSFTLRLKVL